MKETPNRIRRRRYSSANSTRSRRQVSSGILRMAEGKANTSTYRHRREWIIRKRFGGVRERRRENFNELKYKSYATQTCHLSWGPWIDKCFPGRRRHEPLGFIIALIDDRFDALSNFYLRKYQSRHVEWHHWSPWSFFLFYIRIIIENKYKILEAQFHARSGWHT